jgi:hypothetical protein
MKIQFHLKTSILCALLSVSSAYAADFVDTSGNVLTKEDLSDTCRPTWKLDNGNIMVFGTSAKDVALLREKLIENGMTDQTRLSR